VKIGEAVRTGSNFRRYQKVYFRVVASAPFGVDRCNDQGMAAEFKIAIAVIIRSITLVLYVQSALLNYVVIVFLLVSFIAHLPSTLSDLADCYNSTLNFSTNMHLSSLKSSALKV